jgi:hypothetical protein
MAVQRFKVPLNNAVFPFVSSKAPRAVFVPQLDAAPRLGKGFVGSEESVDYNVTQIIYGENFMPTAHGVHSVGYIPVIAPTVNLDFDSIFPLRDSQEKTVLYSPSKGRNYVYDPVAAAWNTTTIATIWAPTVLHATSIPADSDVTYAYVDGKTFVCYSRLKSNDDPSTDMSIMQWDEATQTLIPATAILANVPFAAGEINGISASNGFLVVWSNISVAWAPFNGTAFDFAPFANGNFTGAGQQIPEDVKGKITAVIPLPGGFVIFTTRNAVAANYYAQSVASPWVFREISNAGGLEGFEQATVEGNLGDVIAYTNSGLQKINLNSAEPVYPAAADFIAGRKTERYDFGTHELIPGGTTLDMFTKVTAIASRYFVVSYGYFPGVYSYALVFDLALERWGKLRVVHRDCFYYTQELAANGLTYSMLLDVAYEDTIATTYADVGAIPPGVTAAQHSIAFLLSTGQVLNATWSDDERPTPDNAVIVIGRMQLSRSSNIQFNRAEAEGMQGGDLLVTPSHNGRNLEATRPLIEIERVGDYLLAGDMIDCKNFNLIVEGQFDLTTVIVEGTSSGKI